MRHTLRILVFFLIANVGIVNVSFAEQSLYLIGDEDNKPECYIDGDGNVTGSDVEILRELGKRLDLKLEIELAPWIRVLSMVQSGKADGGFPLFVTPERKEYALYSKVPIHVSVMTLYTQSDHEFDYNDFSDLYHKKIGINRGYSISEEFDLAAQAGDIQITEVDSIDQLVKMLTGGRIDAIAATPSSITTYLKEHGIEISAIGHVRSRAAYLTLSKVAKIKDKDQLLEKINQELRVMEQEGIIEEITQKYLDY
jgi:ABC-type amino acid transport substrate-binding protein